MADSNPPRYSTRPASRAPARVGAPPSTRNFGDSSAAGVNRVPPRFNAGTQDGSGGDAGTGTKEVKIKTWGEAYVPEEDSIRNDYATHYVRTGSRPQNHLRGADVASRFSEYPKLASLLREKHALHSSPTYSIPPTYLSMSPSDALLALPPVRFDAILLSPPGTVSFEELQKLDMGRVAASPGFVWLWVGSGARGDGIGLERGRELIANWGYRRCEDIVWLKTNKSDPLRDLAKSDGDQSLFRPTVEHCLMGIRGTVRRSNDPWFVHCNVDTDIMVWEGDPEDPLLKPPELQSLIENFCLGTRRLHLFGSPHSLRRGWLTVGENLLPLSEGLREIEGEETKWTAVPWDKDAFAKRFTPPTEPGGDGAASPPTFSQKAVPTLLPFVEELDALRPKSPPIRNGLASSGGLGRGRGAGLGITRSGMLPQHRGHRGPPPNNASVSLPLPQARHSTSFPSTHVRQPFQQQQQQQQQQQHQYLPPLYPYYIPPPPPPPSHLIPSFGYLQSPHYPRLSAYGPQPLAPQAAIFYPSNQTHFPGQLQPAYVPHYQNATPSNDQRQPMSQAWAPPYPFAQTGPLSSSEFGDR